MRLNRAPKLFAFQAARLREARVHGHPRVGRRTDARRASRRAEQHEEAAPDAAELAAEGRRPARPRAGRGTPSDPASAAVPAGGRRRAGIERQKEGG